MIKKSRIRYYRSENRANRKFLGKVMIWHTIDDDGNISDPVFFQGTVNKALYYNECVLKVLKPSSKNTIKSMKYWPDMTTSHYTKVVTLHLREENMNFVEKTFKAPNVLFARVIERFWIIMKCKYFKIKNTTKNLANFKRSYRTLLKTETTKTVQQIMKKGRSNLRKIEKQGVYSSM